MVLEAQQILLGQELVEPGLVDAADDGCLLRPVADALGQGERRGDDVEHAEREEAAHPVGVMQVGDAEEGGTRGDAERER